MQINIPETFIEGLQYLTTLSGGTRGGGKGRLGALEKALLSFKRRGVSASIESSSPSVVTIDVYVDIEGKPQRFSPPPITRQTADAYEHLIQTIRECGYTEIKELRDGRTGLEESIPLFEIVDVNHH